MFGSPNLLLSERFRIVANNNWMILSFLKDIIRNPELEVLDMTAQ